MENEKNNKKGLVTLIVGIGILFALIFSATFAYFSVTSTNNFGSNTINATAESTGSVTLNGTSATLRLNLARSDMMKGASDITYWGTSDGTPSTTQNVVTIGNTQVTGAGYFNCNYTLNVTATGTNNMYTAFQGMSGKSTEQIVLKIGDTKYDFNTANLFPITINGTLNGVSSTSVKALTAEFYLVNKEGVIQDALEGKDLNITITATSFSCTVAVAPQETIAYYTYVKNANEGSDGQITAKADSPNASWQYYIKETSTEMVAEEDIYGINYGEYDSKSACESDNDGAIGGSCEQVGTKYAFVDETLLSYQECETLANDFNDGSYCVKRYSSGETYTKVTNEVCAVFNNSSDGTVCLKPNDYANVDSYYEKMHNLGLACNDYQHSSSLICSNGTTYNQPGSLNCIMYGKSDRVSCGVEVDSRCDVNSDGTVGCYSS